MTFFASTYASEFGFVNGPPVHDMLAVAYIIDPTLFDMPDPFGHRSSDASNVSTSAAPARTRPPRRYIVDVETLENSLACGATVVDFYGDRKVVHEGWGRGGRNVEVLEQVDVSPFCFASALWSCTLAHANPYSTVCSFRHFGTCFLALSIEQRLK